MRRAHTKLIPLLLSVAIFCSACEVPDLTEFSKQSAEMTRGIRTGVNDTATLIKTASDRKDLYSDETRAALKKELKNYQTGVKPTLEALDALDAYLDALNALAVANKKSEENSRAAVNAVTNLVTAVSGFTFAGPAVNVATGLVTLAERFRTSRDFKERVNLAAEIVEGKFVEKKDAAGNVVADDKGKPVLVKACGEKAEAQVTEASGRIKKLVAEAMQAKPGLTPPELTKAQLDELQGASPEERREKLKQWKHLTDEQYAEIKIAEVQIGSLGCGVIDLLKFNVSDLRKIVQTVSDSMFANIQEESGAVLASYKDFRTRRSDIRDELGPLVGIKNLISQINELALNHADKNGITSRKVRLKEDLDDVFARDTELKKQTLEAISKCGADCGRMMEVLQLQLPDPCDDEKCVKDLVSILDHISKEQFDRSTGIIFGVLHDMQDKRVAEDQSLGQALDRLKPDYDAAIGQLNAVAAKRDQLDSLHAASLSALKAWADSHANLRVAVNTKKPLTVAKLTSEVRAIWQIIQPADK